MESKLERNVDKNGYRLRARLGIEAGPVERDKHCIDAERLHHLTKHIHTKKLQ